MLHWPGSTAVGWGLTLIVVVGLPPPMIPAALGLGLAAARMLTESAREEMARMRLNILGSGIRAVGVFVAGAKER